MTATATYLVMLGPPGSGKGTQAALLAERLGLPAVSTGDMVRAAVASGNELGRRVERIVAAGELVDDDTMGSIVRQRLAEDDVACGCILDGYPRTRPQADTLEAILEASGHRLGAVVRIDVDEAELVSRMLGRGRADDSEDVIRRRLRVYEERTAPLVDYYRDRGKLLDIDGNGSIEAVNGAILAALSTAVGVTAAAPVKEVEA